MKREFLKGLNLESDVIDKIMAQHGEDIEKYKSQATELEKLKNDIKERDEQLEKLKNSSLNVEDLKKQIESLQAENKKSADKYQKEIKQIQINNAVEKALTGAKSRNNKLVMPLLTEFLKTAQIDEQGNISGLSDEIKKLTEADDTKFLFESSAKQNKLQGITPASQNSNTFGFVDQAAFNANKNNPDWINKNWDVISVALKEGTIKSN